MIICLFAPMTYKEALSYLERIKEGHSLNITKLAN